MNHKQEPAIFQLLDNYLVGEELLRGPKVQGNPELLAKITLGLTRLSKCIDQELDKICDENDPIPE
jgi:hypothetical protein